MPLEEHYSLAAFTEKAYLDYAMYVILDRALPALADGLKPVQRRLVYAMSELGLSAGSKYKKSARTVGDVLGKYHPHGDSACYEAMVLMAQNFSYRYPLIDGQGNWGSADDPKSFAAMRYTESKLTAYAHSLLAELNPETVDWTSNFDGTLQEPKTLPARLPNILLNGGSGIAVGMSTDIPPHNMGEIVAACQALLKNPQLSEEALLQIVPAPDFPTGGVLINTREEIAHCYRTGSGSVRLRASYHIEKDNIVIDELPYQVSGSKVQEQITQQIQEKKLLWLEAVRDESDHKNPTRLVLLPRSHRIDKKRLMQHLFATTDLEKTVRIQLNMIGLDGKPQIKPLIVILREWLTYREQTVMRRLSYRLHALNERLEILAGLRIAFLQLDTVIQIIREHDDAQTALMQALPLTAAQSEAILNIRLRQLAKLEENAIVQEEKTLIDEQKSLQNLIDNRDARLQFIADELAADAQNYADPRRTTFIKPDAKTALPARAWQPSEAVTLVLSKMAWVRLAKTHQVDGRTLAYKSGDEFLLQIAAKSDQTAILCGNDGRCYALSLANIASARGYGEPLSRYFSFAEKTTIVAAAALDPEQYYVLAANNAYGFVVKGSDLVAKTKKGKAVLNVGKANALALLPLFDEESLLCALDNTGRTLIFPARDLPQQSKGKGNKIMAITQKEWIQGVRLKQLLILPPQASCLLTSGKRSMQLNAQNWAPYCGARGQKGVYLPQPFRNADVEVIMS